MSESLVYDANDPSTGVTQFVVNIQGIPLGISRVELSADRRTIRFQRALTINGLSRELWLAKMGKTKGIARSLKQLFGTCATVAVLVKGKRDDKDEVWNCELRNLTFRGIQKHPGHVIEEMKGTVLT